MPIARQYCLGNDKLIANRLHHKFSLVQNHSIDFVLLSVCILVQSVMQFKAYWVVCRLLFGVTQIEVDDRVELLEVVEIKLVTTVVVILSVTVIIQIVQNHCFGVACVWTLGVKRCAIQKFTSGQSRGVVAIDVERVKEIRVMPEIVPFPGLLEEHEDVLRFFHPGRYHPRTIGGSHGYAPSQNFFHVFHLAAPQVVFIDQLLTCKLPFWGKQLLQSFERCHRFGRSFLCRPVVRFRTQAAMAVAACQNDFRRRSIGSKG